jgi:hypothetical protein
MKMLLYVYFRYRRFEMSERIERPAGVFARKTARHLRIANASIKTIG